MVVIKRVDCNKKLDKHSGAFNVYVRIEDLILKFYLKHREQSAQKSRSK